MHDTIESLEKENHKLRYQLNFAIDMTDKDVELFIYLLDFTPAIIAELKEIIKLRRDVGELRIYSERLEQMLRIRTENNAYLMEQLDKADEEIKHLIEEKWSSFDREREE